MVAVVPEASCLQLVQGSVTGSVSVATIGTATANTAGQRSPWALRPAIPVQYAGNIRGGTTAVPALSLAIATPAVGGTPVELIRRPVTGESAQLTEERYFTLSSVNILLDDTAALLTSTPGTCGTPVDLTTLAVDRVGNLQHRPLSRRGTPAGRKETATANFRRAQVEPLPIADDRRLLGQAHNPIITGYILMNGHTTSEGGCVD